MPPVDLGTLFASERHRHVSSDTQISVFSSSAATGPPFAKPTVPPESFNLQIRRDIRWVKVLNRLNSTMGNANPKSNRSGSKPKSCPPRFATGATASKHNGPIIAIPAKTKHSIFSGNSVRPVTNFGFFQRKIAVIDGEWKSVFPDTVSPKASCFRGVFAQNQNRASRRPSDSEVVDVEVGEKGAQCFASFAAILRYRSRLLANVTEVKNDSSADRSSKYSEEGKVPAAKVDAMAPAVQAMERFLSERKLGSIAQVVEVMDSGRLRTLEPLDREGVFGRR